MSRMTEIGWCGNEAMYPVKVERDIVEKLRGYGKWPPGEIRYDCRITWRSPERGEFSMLYSAPNWMIEEAETAAAEWRRAKQAD